MDPEPSPILELFPQLFFLEIGLVGITTSLVILICLLFCSAFISGSEIAFFSLSPVDSENLKEESSPASQKILLLLKKPSKLLATILITNNFVNIGIVILSAFVLDYFISEEAFIAIGAGLENLLPGFLTPEVYATGISFLIKIVAVTFLLVLFGEVAPKIYASLNNLRFAKFMAPALHLLNRLFGPLSNVLVVWGNGLETRLLKNSNTSTTKEDLDHAIELTVSQHTEEENEADILRGILKFSDLSVKQIMCPRLDIVGFEKSQSYHDLLSLIRESGYSRIPIYEESMDTVLGILYVKDLISYISEDEDFTWLGLIRHKLMFVPETKKVNELLKDFQRERVHMAIVVDEYGGVSGLVTLEDVMEEVIGDIKDEFDEDEELEYVKIDEHNYIFEGKTNLTDVARIIDIDSTIFDKVKGDSDSLAGLILEILGFIPKIDREVVISNIKLKVVTVNKKRIEKVTLTIQK